MKYHFDFVTLMWAYVILPSFFLKALCTRLLILDLNRLCGIEVKSVEKSNVWTSSWSSDDNKLAEFLRIQPNDFSQSSAVTPPFQILIAHIIKNRTINYHFQRWF